MRKLSLSSKNGKITAIVADLFLVGLITFFIVLSINGLFSVAITVVAAVLALPLMFYYTAVMFFSNCIYDEKTKTLSVGLFGKEKYDMSNVTAIKTEASVMGQKNTRLIVLLTNDETLPPRRFATLISDYNGALNEVFAKELANICGIEFLASVDKAEYDKVAKKEKEKLQAEKEKEAKRNKKNGKQNASQIDNSKTVTEEIPVEEPSEVEEDINYDELDDQKVESEKNK